MINSLNQRQVVIGLAVVVAVYLWLGYSFIVLKQPAIARIVYIVLLCFGGGLLLHRSLSKDKRKVFEIEPHSNPIGLTIWLAIVASALLWGCTLLFRSGFFSSDTLSAGLITCGTPATHYWWIAGTFAIVNPIAEEFLWRKNMVPLLRSKMNRQGTILVSALLFAGYHPLAIILLFPPLWLFGVFLVCFIGGIFLAHLYIRTRKIRYPIALHMVININLMIIWWLYTPSATP